MTQSQWQFWIDVGGTFTDCLARSPSGELLRHKLLSSAVTKGSIGSGSTSRKILDPLRGNDPPGFWRGFRFRLLSETGEPGEEITVADFDAQAAELLLSGELSSNIRKGAAYELASDLEAPVLGIRYVLGLPPEEPIPGCSVRLGTTRGTNALLTRRGAQVALVTTAGFRDILRIGYQNRPRLFELAIEQPPPLFAEVIEVDERIAADGEVLVPLGLEAARDELAQLQDRGIESLAICLLNAYEHSQHEEQLAAAARELGFADVSVSHEVAPLIKLVSRGDTTVVDAYLNPVLTRYVARLRESLGPAVALRVLTSAGGLIGADQFTGKDSILSGPAGGVVGMARSAEAAGFSQAIGFDMGGTSTDVSRYEGQYEREYETEKAGARIVAPMMAIETVASGGGSICHFDGVKLAVGPDSAGADPGPACYGRGGPLAVTDVNFVLGRIRREHFPFPLDHDAVEEKLSAMCGQIADATGRHYEPLELAEGFVRVANANMAAAIRSISVAGGYDPRSYVLVSFGGAAPQHACGVARELGMTQILNHPSGGVLSAYGIGLADIVRHGATGVYREYSDEVVQQLDETFDSLAAPLVEEVQVEGVAAEDIAVHRALDLRYRGLDAFLTIDEPESGTYAEAYTAAHQENYGYTQPDRPIEIVAARVEVVGQSGAQAEPSERRPEKTPRPDQHAEIYFEGRWQDAPLYERGKLEPGHLLQGPAIVAEAISTTVIDPGWKAEMFSGGELLLTDTSGKKTADVSTEADPVMLEIFNRRFAGIAEQMGITLRQTASSVNVKERLDFSCAIFTGDGRLVVNAPHIPVHLGAMGLTVQRVIDDNPDMRPGDVFVTNDPFRGGSHLPDITVISPVYNEAGERLFFTASRAHHAEIGGITPGSMPPDSRSLAEEGVLIRSFRLFAAGESRLDELRELLTSAPYPSRDPDTNLADINAQVAANRRGARDLLAMIGRYSLPVVAAYMQHIQGAAERKMRRALEKLPDGRREFVDHLDGGAAIQAAVTIDGDTATIDFTGTDDVLPGNLNANRAIVTAAVLYVMRCLIDEDIPLNAGVLTPVEIVLPPCLLNPPEGPTAQQCAAVAGGNVETSQRVVDVLLGAFQLAAASQGTMNNLLFGDESFGYYETICGGVGATADADGASAVHTHMTNTRLTDPEVLEQRFPVRVREFSIRTGSGGAGRHRGGDGALRRIEFLRPLDLSIVSQRRGQFTPYGLAGGEPGQIGRNQIRRADGRVETLPAICQTHVEPGDILAIETPGGGGYGE